MRTVSVASLFCLIVLRLGLHQIGLHLLHDPFLCKGVGLAFKLLVILSFRMPKQQADECRQNSTTLILAHASNFLRSNPKLFLLLLQYNINIDALSPARDGLDGLPQANKPGAILSSIFHYLHTLTAPVLDQLSAALDGAKEQAMPVCRDASSFAILQELVGKVVQEGPRNSMQPVKKDFRMKRRASDLPSTPLQHLYDEDETDLITTLVDEIDEGVSKAASKQSGETSLDLHAEEYLRCLEEDLIESHDTMAKQRSFATKMNQQGELRPVLLLNDLILAILQLTAAHRMTSFLKVTQKKWLKAPKMTEIIGRAMSIKWTICVLFLT